MVGSRLPGLQENKVSDRFRLLVVQGVSMTPGRQAEFVVPDGSGNLRLQIVI